MKSFLSFLNSKLDFTSVALGKFDGCHRAHLELIKLLDKQGCALSIMASCPPYITPPIYREKLLGVPCFFLPFEKIRFLDSNEFLKILCDTLPKLQKIVVGYDFSLGHNKMHSAIDLPILLEQIGKKNISTKILEKQEINNIPLHTSIIKELIKYGDIKTTNNMLGRFYSIKGSVIEGQGLGKKLLYPTINIESNDFVFPKNGVYISLVKINNNTYKSVSFIGHRVSTDQNFCIESHVIEDFDLEIRSGEIEIKFIERLRDNKKFDNLDELKGQIKIDIDSAINFFKNFNIKG